MKDCDVDGKWIENFEIFDGLPRDIETFRDAKDNKTYCCHHFAHNGTLEPDKVCNWNNKDIFLGTDNPYYAKSDGKTGFLCKHLGDYESMYNGTRDEDTFRPFSIDVTYNAFRSGMKGLDGLLDPETKLPWYDTGRQWPKQAECSYGSAIDQMTMTYISFTGYLR